MGQVQSGSRSRKLSKKSKSKNRGDFENFSELPYELRYLIWDFAQPPRVVEVIRTRYNHSARWVSRNVVPITLRINRETRTLALKRYKFHEKERVKIFLDPAIDTLFFRSDSPPDLAKFLLDAGEEDLKSLRHLAINEYAFSIWNTPKMFPQLGFLMMDLERLMIGTRIASYQYQDARTAGFDRWDGWLFGLGPPTGAESLNLLGRTREQIFSMQTLHGQLIYFPPDEHQYLCSDRRPGYIPISPPMAMGAFRKIFGYHWLRGSSWRSIYGVKTADTDDEVIDYEEWFLRTYTAFAKIDFRVKRMLAFHRRKHPEMTASWGKLKMGCFAKQWSTDSDFSTWVGCLKPLCDAEWPA